MLIISKLEPTLLKLFWREPRLKFCGGLAISIISELERRIRTDLATHYQTLLQIKQVHPTLVRLLDEFPLLLVEACKDITRVCKPS